MTDPAPTNRWAFLHTHGFLAFLLGLVAVNVAVLVALSGSWYQRTLNLMVSLTLLFQHLAIRYAKPGRPRRTLQALAVVFLAATGAFIVLEWTRLLR